MNWLGLVPVILGIVYLIYSVLCRNKINYQIRRFFRKSPMEVKNSRKFLNLQLKFSILNSIYCILYGTLIIIFNINNIFIILGLLGFSIINFSIIVQGKEKGYIYYK